MNASANSASASIDSAAEAPEPVKLPYFHRELSSEDQALLSKNVPRKIEISADGTISSSDTIKNTVVHIETDSKLSTASAWNAAQCWEERNSTETCIELLAKALKTPGVMMANTEIKDTLGIRFININKDDIEGAASITHSRGKARFMYEMTFIAQFEITVPNVLPTTTTAAAAATAAAAGKGGSVGGSSSTWSSNVSVVLDTSNTKLFKGKLKIVEINNDQSARDIDMEVTWSGGSPTGAAMGYTRKLLMGPEVRDSVRHAMSLFEEEYKRI